jgi:hypothetical protein
MSGFSADWLALREPADHAARNAALRDRVATAFAGRRDPLILDLACGAGSNLRGLAPFLPERQRWRLVDHDPFLLDAARARLADWAERVESSEPLILSRDGKRISVDFRRADLARGVDVTLTVDVDLIAAAAFFDLVSPEWIARFAQDIAARRLPLYAVLTYSGEESRWPPQDGDAAMLAAFHAHQARDKGFGAAAGPRAADILQAALEAQGYAVARAPSSWRLGAADAALMRALDEGAAQAARETGLIASETIDAWRAAPRARCEIGHWDLFAQPK